MKRGVQHRRFTGTGGAHDQNHPVRFFQDFEQLAAVSFRQADTGQGEYLALCQDSHHDVLDATLGGDGRDTKLDFVAGGPFEFDFTVLGDPFHGDVQIGHDFDP